MMSNELPTYLSIEGQQEVRNKLKLVIKQAPLREKFFYHYGGNIASGLMLGSSVIYYRCGYIAYNMIKYNRGRFITPFMLILMTPIAAQAHILAIGEELNSLYRTENKWYYGYKSLLAHQSGQFLCLAFAIGTTFLNSQLSGMIPIRTYFFRNSGKKIEGLKYGFTKLKPYRSTIAATWLITSAIMFTVGTLEYQDTCKLLAKLNRKSVSHKEV